MKMAANAWLVIGIDTANRRGVSYGSSVAAHWIHVPSIYVFASSSVSTRAWLPKRVFGVVGLPRAFPITLVFGAGGVVGPELSIPSNAATQD